ncbi:metallophosphoesterase [Marinifilum caeruleilacunae]|uniref:Metallophosphoesterase n=1 Tax=Marinifilum caeruleilacunae TaxID=2499076 RepID=A0ABX1WWY8_9BACT|nr:metallophosphoesterase [Marinifilum caeruleilacunae]NOU60594.1 metallophosphoesterase [Marinifilum caeruleilacunae]
MLIQYCSDLHLEFNANENFLIENPIEPVGDILILAGDIVPFAILNQYMWFFEYLSSKFKYSYWVPGNHEYYKSDIQDRSGVLNEKIYENVYLVNNVSIQHENVNFIFSTLWSKIWPLNRQNVKRGLSDFFSIRNGDERFSPEDFNDLHKKAVQFIEESLLKSTSKVNLIATHHVPTFNSYPEEYENSPINNAFVSEQEDLIEIHDIDYWIFGHHHVNVEDFEMHNTRFLTNQLGYVSFEEHHAYKTRVIEV